MRHADRRNSGARRHEKTFALVVVAADLSRVGRSSRTLHDSIGGSMSRDISALYEDYCAGCVGVVKQPRASMCRRSLTIVVPTTAVGDRGGDARRVSQLQASAGVPKPDDVRACSQGIHSCARGSTRGLSGCVGRYSSTSSRLRCTMSACTTVGIALQQLVVQMSRQPAHPAADG